LRGAEAAAACLHRAESSRAPPAPGPSLVSATERGGAPPVPLLGGWALLPRLADTPLPCSLLGGEVRALRTRCCSPAPAATRDRTPPARPASRPTARPAALVRSAPRRFLRRAEGRGARGRAQHTQHARCQARAPAVTCAGAQPPGCRCLLLLGESVVNTVPPACCCLSVSEQGGICCLPFAFAWRVEAAAAARVVDMLLQYTSKIEAFGVMAKKAVTTVGAPS